MALKKLAEINKIIIAESHHLPRRPPLEICMAHTKQLMQLMSRSGLGSCAFASVDATLERHQHNSTTSKQPQIKPSNNSSQATTTINPLSHFHEQQFGNNPSSSASPSPQQSPLPTPPPIATHQPQ